MLEERTVDEEREQLGRIFPRGPFLDRRLGRALAFQALYEMDLGHHAPNQVLERLAEGFGEASASPYPDEILRDACSYAQELVRGVLANRTAIDGLIQLRAPLWPLAQMSAVDRNVLRIGLYESLYSNATVPLRTAINEAVELAKLCGSEDEVTPEANFIDDLNADSLDLVELIMSLEEEFNVKISDDDAEKIRTVQDAMDYLHEHGGA